MKLVSKIEIIRRRDNLSLKQLRAINKECKKKFGMVCMQFIIKTMGYEHAFNDKYYDNIP